MRESGLRKVLELDSERMETRACQQAFAVTLVVKQKGSWCCESERGSLGKAGKRKISVELAERCGRIQWLPSTLQTLFLIVSMPRSRGIWDLRGRCETSTCAWMKHLQRYICPRGRNQVESPYSSDL